MVNLYGEESDTGVRLKERRVIRNLLSQDFPFVDKDNRFVPQLRQLFEVFHYCLEEYSRFGRHLKDTETRLSSLQLQQIRSGHEEISRYINDLIGLVTNSAKKTADFVRVIDQSDFFQREDVRIVIKAKIYLQSLEGYLLHDWKLLRRIAGSLNSQVPKIEILCTSFMLGKLDEWFDATAARLTEMVAELNSKEIMIEKQVREFRSEDHEGTSLSAGVFQECVGEILDSLKNIEGSDPELLSIEERAFLETARDIADFMREDTQNHRARIFYIKNQCNFDYVKSINHRLLLARTEMRTDFFRKGVDKMLRPVSTGLRKFFERVREMVRDQRDKRERHAVIPPDKIPRQDVPVLSQRDISHVEGIVRNLITNDKAARVVESSAGEIEGEIRILEEFLRECADGKRFYIDDAAGSAKLAFLNNRVEPYLTMYREALDEKRRQEDINREMLSNLPADDEIDGMID